MFYRKSSGNGQIPPHRPCNRAFAGRPGVRRRVLPARAARAAGRPVAVGGEAQGLDDLAERGPTVAVEGPRHDPVPPVEPSHARFELHVAAGPPLVPLTPVPPLVGAGAVSVVDTCSVSLGEFARTGPNFARYVESGRVRGAGLDVLPEEPVPRDSPLVADPRVILTPHAAFYSVEAEKELRRKAAQNIKAAKKMVDSMIPEVWDVLEEVIRSKKIAPLLGTRFDAGEVLPPYPLSALPHSIAIVHKDGNVFAEDKVTRRALTQLYDKPALHLELAQRLGLFPAAKKPRAAPAESPVKPKLTNYQRIRKIA